MCRINCKKELLEEKVWVSCSGGIDSIAGAHYLFKKLKLDVSLFHFNHGNGEVNDKMEEGVVNFARKFNLPLKTAKLDASVKEADEHGSLEAFFRYYRLEAMEEICGDSQVVFCHHLNDCVESYLMNCFNGSPEYCPIPITTQFEGPRVVRPFLVTPKKALQNYAENYRLTDFVVPDPSNADTKFRRNWIRHRALPCIEEQYPGLEKVVLKKMDNYYRKLIYEKKMTDPSGYVWEGK